MKKELRNAVVNSAKALWKSLPILIGIILLISLANAIIPKEAYFYFFRGSFLLDPLIGSAIGSILAGNPITSYIMGGELLEQGISLIAITAFLVSWVTVGLVQFPAEASLLGKKFAIIRNITAFFLAIVAAIITISILRVI